MKLLVFALTSIFVSYADASTCYRSKPVEVNIDGAVKPAVVTVMYSDRGPGAIQITTEGVNALATLFCETEQPVRCQVEGDSGSVILSGDGAGLNLIARGQQLGAMKDDGGGFTVATSKVRGTREYAMDRLKPATCRKIFGQPSKITVFP